MSDVASMRVLTWNLWWRFGPWERRMTAIRAVLREPRPDVIGLQEVWAVGGENLAGLLAEELGMHWRRDPPPGRLHTCPRGTRAGPDRRLGVRRRHTALGDAVNPYVAATFGPSVRVDYVYVGMPDATGAGRVLSVRRAGDGPVDDVWPSDHAAVLVELAL